MKTYLTLYFNSNGIKPSEATKVLECDFVYDWKSKGQIEEIIGFADKVKSILEEHSVVFKMETI
jgi:hypothetical protein